ncbi:hypothetical protein ON010_g439 [Phytophthora cinnamomi]|nr:hypothetical protein ON010_g439 [Phytophthora cinnamomi]
MNKSEFVDLVSSEQSSDEEPASIGMHEEGRAPASTVPSCRASVEPPQSRAEPPIGAIGDLMGGSDEEADIAGEHLATQVKLEMASSAEDVH